LASVLGGAGPFAAIGATASGALAGLVLGGSSRSLRRLRWSEHGLPILDVPAGHSYTLVIVKTNGLELEDRQRIIRALVQDGALAFVEPTALARLTSSTG
jgi:hypothetical protein